MSPVWGSNRNVVVSTASITKRDINTINSLRASADLIIVSIAYMLIRFFVSNMKNDNNLYSNLHPFNADKEVESVSSFCLKSILEKTVRLVKVRYYFSTF